MLKKRMAMSGTIALAGIVLAWHRRALELYRISPPRLDLRAPYTRGDSESGSLRLRAVCPIRLAYAVGPLDALHAMPYGDSPRY